MNSAAKAKLDAAAHAVGVAVSILQIERETIEAFLTESEDMGNFGHVLDPTLYRNSERRAVDALIAPIFQAALDFMRRYETMQRRATAALAEVSR